MPSPNTSKERFTRVIAIAIQGVMNAHPKRALNLPTFLYYIRTNIFEWDDDIMAASISLRDRLRKHLDLEMGALEFVPEDNGQIEGDLVHFHWVQRRFNPYGLDTFPPKSQEEVERMYASIFTHPYPVTHVSYRAQQIAKEMVAETMPYVFTRRWRP